MCSGDIFLGLVAILFPPIAVWIKRGVCTADSLINIALCCLGFVPGLLHAWYIIAKYPEAPDGYENIPGDGGENGRVTYFYGTYGPAPQQQQHGQWQQQGYGTNDRMRVERPKKGQASDAQRPGQEQGQGQGSSADEGVPPSYEQAVKGDHKVQT